MGAAVGYQIGRHVHPGVKPETTPDPAPPTGIDYLGLVRDRHAAALREPPLNHAALAPHTADTTKTVGTVDITGTRTNTVGGFDPALEAELASFATLLPVSPAPAPTEGVIPGQRDLFDPTDNDEPKENQ